MTYESRTIHMPWYSCVCVTSTKHPRLIILIRQKSKTQPCWVIKKYSALMHRSVLQCVAVCCSVLQCVAVCCSVLQCVAMCCSVLQCFDAPRISCIFTERWANKFFCGYQKGNTHNRLGRVDYLLLLPRSLLINSRGELGGDGTHAGFGVSSGLWLVS